MIRDQGFMARWSGAEGQKLARACVTCLIEGRSLDSLGLGVHEGRIDLRGLPVPGPQAAKRYAVQGWEVTELTALTRLDRVELASLDLSHAVLPEFRLFNVRIHDCRFDGAMCQSWRTWALDVEESSFVRADLRYGSLDGWYEGRGNVYRSVDFQRANMVDAFALTATFVDCDFSHAKLVRVDFGGSSFIRCRFAGTLREVEFAEFDLHRQKTEPNPMEDVDFRDAELRWVDFHGLPLDRVQLPTSPNHVYVRHYPCVLERAIAELAGNTRMAARGFEGLLLALRARKPRSEIGVFHVDDLREACEGDLELALGVLQRAGAACTEGIVEGQAGDVIRPRLDG